MKHCRSSVVALVFDNSLLLLIGTAAAVLWANLDLATYEAFADPLHFWVNEIGMVFFWTVPVQFVLLFFGLANAGVPFERIGAGTYYVLAGLLLGKPLGILLFSAASRLVGAQLPEKLHLGDLLMVGIVASIGFTVSLFFATAAFPGGVALAETKMGALLSFVAAPIALAVARLRRAGAREVAL